MRLAQRIADLLAHEPGEIVVPAPGPGDGYWAGAPSAVMEDRTSWLAYRLRAPADRGRGYANVIARSDDGVRFTEVARVTNDRFGSASLERPALVRRPDGGWRLYVSCSTPGSKHWWVEALDADEPAGLPAGARTTVLPGSAGEAWKDVVVRRDGGHWRMWACRHPLDGGADEADRMTSWAFEGDDGLAWSAPVLALAPRAGSWDARGTRITCVLPGDPWTACYDGRASAAENWQERTGAAEGVPEAFVPVAGPTPPGRACRYVTAVEVPDGVRLYWEASAAEGAHDLRTALLP